MSNKTVIAKMGDAHTIRAELKKVEKRIGAYRKNIEDCRRQKIELEHRLFALEWDIRLGDVVIHEADHEQYQVVGLLPTGIGNGQPLVRGRRRLANGDWSLKEQFLYAGWAKIK